MRSMMNSADALCELDGHHRVASQRRKDTPINASTCTPRAPLTAAPVAPPLDEVGDGCALEVELDADCPGSAIRDNTNPMSTQVM